MSILGCLEACLPGLIPAPTAAVLPGPLLDAEAGLVPGETCFAVCSGLGLMACVQAAPKTFAPPAVADSMRAVSVATTQAAGYDSLKQEVQQWSLVLCAACSAATAYFYSKVFHGWDWSGSTRVYFQHAAMPEAAGAGCLAQQHARDTELVCSWACHRFSCWSVQ